MATPDGGSTTAQSTPSSSGPTPEEVQEAEHWLPLCRQEQPGVTLQELEQEAASPLGIQC